MFAIIGTLIIIGSVFGGFVLGGGHLGAMFQPLELLMIGGASLGAFIAGSPTKVIKATVMAIPSSFGGARYSKAAYMDLMALLYELLNKIRKEGMMAIERDVDAPEESPLFQRYGKILADHHVVEFITDYLRIMVSGNLNPFEIENLMDHEIETHHHEQAIPSHAVQRVADGLPAFGIVAAVMGVVHTMESVGAPPAELGMMVARALVGTFLGILLAYGFAAPLASILEQQAEEKTKMLQTIKVTLLASLNGYPPTMAVEFGRKVLYSTERPGFAELESHVKQPRS